MAEYNDPLTNVNSANGNSASRETTVHITTSTSQNELSGLAAHPLLGFNHFLSAKNSTEIHKKKVKFERGNQSLPSVFAPSDYAKLKSGMNVTDNDGVRVGSSIASSKSGTRESKPKKVDWVDLHRSHAQQMFVPENHADQSSNDVESPLNGLSETLDDLAEEIETISRQIESQNLQEKAPAKYAENAVKDSPIAMDKSYTYPALGNDAASTDRAQMPLKSPAFQMRSEEPFQKAQRGLQSPKQALNPSYRSVSNESTMYHTPRNALPEQTSLISNASVGNNAAHLITNDIYKTMAEYNGRLPANPSYADCTSPLIGQYCPFPAADGNESFIENPVINLSNHQQLPYNDYYKENQTSDAAPDMGFTPAYYDEDDDYLEPEKKNAPFFPNPDDLPVPDPAFVAANTPRELHSQIALTYKKDCRTWLWKSASQRSSILLKQQQELQLSRQSSR